MAANTKDAKGTTFFEDYTYNLVKGREGILQAHMLEVCPTIADGRIAIKGARCRWETVRIRQDLYLQPKKATALPTSLIDLGDRFRLIINDVVVKRRRREMPKLPVATAFWTPGRAWRQGRPHGFMRAALTTRVLL